MSEVNTDSPVYRRAYSLRQTAEVLGYNTRTIKRLVRRGDMKSVLLSPRRRVVLSAEIDRFLQSKISA